MHSRAPTPVTPARSIRALQGAACLCLLMLGGWAGKPAVARLNEPGPVATETTTRPYLRVGGPLALRFQPAPVAPEPSSRPAASGPPLPNESPAHSETTPLPAVIVEPTPHPADISAEPAKAATTTPESPPIIPDEMRPRAQAEDFLPYFQFPTSGNTTLVVPPNPPHHATPSTATYRQQ